jgi:hypothetical protein
MASLPYFAVNSMVLCSGIIFQSAAWLADAAMKIVIPAKAGIHIFEKRDTSLRWYDNRE